MSGEWLPMGKFVTPKLLGALENKGKVWCRTCRKTQSVNSIEAMANGWPKCCNQTMTIDPMPVGRPPVEKKEKRKRKKPTGGKPKNRIFRLHMEIPLGVTEEQVMEFCQEAIVQQIVANKKWNPNDLRASLNVNAVKIERLTPRYQEQS